ncbi:uncharacterized protein N7498_004664 [Penicillium cinerascens]|uniref:Short chain dehydrogenase/reductase n=1 Tax=Penicillium cinerascens TaxID=70096 RepID=A0A9W9MM96_9EURO|nr:uncharacterized protein N7498_004664 [Penicillium cinerascens]KAJ5203785.1 hypothetical protein N7498_004664 [Penicillium cinerascens]
MSPKRSIIVTGGASGIGLGITRHFISEPNTHITILDVNPTTGAQTLDQLRSEFPSAGVSFESCDVSSWESQAAVFERIYEQQGRIDVVFANAGITEKGTLLPENVDSSKGPTKPNLATVNVNFVGVIYSTKHGVIGLVRSLARPLEAQSIRINALAPAVIATNIAPSKELFKSMILTPMSTAAKAVAQLVGDETLTGRVAELHGEHVTLAEPPAYVDEDTDQDIRNCRRRPSSQPWGKNQNTTKNHRNA